MDSKKGGKAAKCISGHVARAQKISASQGGSLYNEVAISRGIKLPIIKLYRAIMPRIDLNYSTFRTDRSFSEKEELLHTDIETSLN